MIGSKRYILVAGLFTAVLFAGEAHAGFQWTAPVNTGPSAVAPAAPLVAPVSPVATQALPNNMKALSTTPDGPASAAPIYGRGMTDDPVTWNANHTRTQQVQTIATQQVVAPQNMAQVAPRAPQSVLPVEATSLYTTAAPPASPTPPSMMAPVSTPSSGSSNYQTTEGFGRDLPLVMAIRQIVPSQYGFVFDDGIDLSAKVSWQGGKPWDVVLQQTLTPLGLGANVRGNVVSIMRAGAGPASTSAMATSGPVMMTQTIQDTTTTTMSPAPMAMETKNDVPLGGYVATPASTLGASPPANLGASITWTSARNSTLRAVLEDWSKRAGVELYWASEYDYPIQSAVNIQGTYEEAVQVLLKGLAESRPRPMGRLHPNLPDGPAVLVIETRQNSM